MRGTSRGGTILQPVGALRVPCLASVLASLIVGLAGPALGDPILAVTSARLGNVFVQGEPPVLDVTVLADAAGFRGRLYVVVSDAYGATAGRRVARLDLAPATPVTRQVSIRTSRLGHFTVTATLYDTRGRSVAQAVTTAGIVPPVDASDAEASGIGYFVLPYNSELPYASVIAAEMRRFGIRWVRLGFDWSADSRPDRPDLSDPAWLDSSSFERWVDAFRENGIEVLGVLFGTARWASSRPDGVAPTKESSAGPEWALAVPRDLSDWELFVRTLAERLRGRVRSWEVWNEPDIELFWVSTSADFIALTRATAGALRAVDADMRVVVNLVDRSPDGVAFADAVLTQVADLLDVFGFHYQPGDLVEVTRAARPLLRPGGAIWNTEAYGAPRRHITWWLSQRADGVERIFPFIYHSPADDSSSPDFQRFGAPIVNSDYTPRIDAIALRTLADLVGSATPVAGGPIGLGYSAYTFASSSGTVVAIADGNDGDTFGPDPSIQLWLQGPREVRRVTVVDLMGNRKVRRVRKGRLRITLQGGAAFLLPEPDGQLTGLHVIRAALKR